MLLACYTHYYAYLRAAEDLALGVCLVELLRQHLVSGLGRLAHAGIYSIYIYIYTNLAHAAEHSKCGYSKPLLCLPYLLHVPIEHIEDPFGPTLDDGYDVAVV